MSGIKTATAPVNLVSVKTAFRLEGTASGVGPAVITIFVGLIKFYTIFLPMTTILKFEGRRLVTVLIVLKSTAAIDYFIVTEGVKRRKALDSKIVVVAALLDTFALAV